MKDEDDIMNPPFICHTCGRRIVAMSSYDLCDACVSPTTFWIRSGRKLGEPYG